MPALLVCGEAGEASYRETHALAGDHVLAGKQPQPQRDDRFFFEFPSRRELSR